MPYANIRWSICFAVIALVVVGCQAARVGSQEQPPDTQYSAEPVDQAIAEQEAEPATPPVEHIRIPGTPISFEMVTVPQATFKIGSSSSEVGRSENEGPQKMVTVDSFQMSRFELSNDAYTIFRYVDRDSDSTAVDGVRFDVDAVARPSTPYEDPAHGMSGRGYPAVGMTQWGALHFAKWVSDKTGQFFRLPTEAEWESACRAGTANYSSTAEFEDIAWSRSNSEGVLHKMGTLGPDALGIFDLLGNAAEWTLDQYDDSFYANLDTSPSINPWRRPERLHPRTVRGGAYDAAASDVRCASRKESDLKWKRRDPQIPKSFWWNTDSPFVGFRLIRPNDQPSKDEQIDFWLLVLGE